MATKKVKFKKDWRFAHGGRDIKSYKVGDERELDLEKLEDASFFKLGSESGVFEGIEGLPPRKDIDDKDESDPKSKTAKK